jgi:hypothetical protein
MEPVEIEITHIEGAPASRVAITEWGNENLAIAYEAPDGSVFFNAGVNSSAPEVQVKGTWEYAVEKLQELKSKGSM